MITDHIIRYESVFDEKELESIIDTIDYFEESGGLVHNKKALHLHDHREVNLSQDLQINLSSSHRIVSFILSKFKPCIDDYIENFSILNNNNFLFYDCKLKKILEGGGFHNWHYENSSMMTSSRSFVIQAYLNHNFEYGETEFLYQGKREKPVAGDVLIFPASFTHTHRGNPPIGGTKYLATTWAMIQGSTDDEY
jgi:hypothetical protein